MKPRATAEPVTAVWIPREVDASTVRRGDRLMIGGHVYTVENMTALPQGGKCLLFSTGETFTMRATTLVWTERQEPQPTIAGRPHRT